MKYYLINYTNTLPEGFGGTAWGPLIKLLPKYKNDVGLIEHEKTHVRQWYAVMALGFLICMLLTLLVSPVFLVLCGVSPFLHQLLYRLVRPYRQWCEVKAYRKQIEVGRYISADFAVVALVEKYGLNLGSQEAAELLVANKWLLISSRMSWL